MAAAIDPSLVNDHSPWSQRAYIILDDMSARGNRSSRLIQSELKQLDHELSQLLSKDDLSLAVPAGVVSTSQGGDGSVDSVPTAAPGAYLAQNTPESFGQHYELSPDQLMELANSLDLNSFTWPFPWIDDLPGTSI